MEVEKYDYLNNLLFLIDSREQIFKISCRCEYCGKRLKNVDNCNKHEEICKNKPIKTKKDFLKIVDKDKWEYIKNNNMLICIIVIRKWNRYETREYMRADGSIYVDVDPYKKKLNPYWINYNKNHEFIFSKPIPEFR